MLCTPDRSRTLTRGKEDRTRKRRKAQTSQSIVAIAGTASVFCLQRNSQGARQDKNDIVRLRPAFRAADNNDIVAAGEDIADQKRDAFGVNRDIVAFDGSAVIGQQVEYSVGSSAVGLIFVPDNSG